MTQKDVIWVGLGAPQTREVGGGNSAEHPVIVRRRGMDSMRENTQESPQWIARWSRMAYRSYWTQDVGAERGVAPNLVWLVSGGMCWILEVGRS